jgi:hypothetical protein
MRVRLFVWKLEGKARAWRRLGDNSKMDLRRAKWRTPVSLELNLRVSYPG